MLLRARSHTMPLLLSYAVAAALGCGPPDADPQPSTPVASGDAVAAAAPGAENLTFHQNAMRWGWYSAETALTPATVGSLQFGRVGTLTPPGLGKVYAQPLYVSDANMPDGSVHNLVVVAGANAQVYAFDDATLNALWTRDLASDPVGSRPQKAIDLVDGSNTPSCGDVNPDFGIVSTPVIDKTLGRIYVVVATKEPGGFHLKLHALSIDGGQDAVPPVEVTGTAASAGKIYTVNPLWNFSRSALLEANGNIYVSLGSHCDWHQELSHGWLLAFSAKDLSPQGNLLNTTLRDPGNSQFLGSIWMSGFGPAADAMGDLYFATGNGPYDGASNFGMSVLRVPPDLDLSKSSSFSPASESLDSSADRDLGSGGVMLFPDQVGAVPQLLLQGGKCSLLSGCQKYVLNRNHLGGKQAGDTGAVWHGNIAGNMWGGPAYFEMNGMALVAYGGSVGAPLSTYRLGTNGSLQLQSSVSVAGCLECRNAGGSQPIVSSKGTDGSTTVVWALNTPKGTGGIIRLLAFEAMNMQHTLFAGPVGPWTRVPPSKYVGGALISPLVANGRVYVPFDGGVAVFGLENQAHAAAFSAPAPAASLPPLGSTAICGSITTVGESTIVLDRPDGSIVTVDISAAQRSGSYSAPLYVSKYVMIHGAFASGGTFNADSLSRIYPDECPSQKP